MAEALFSAHFAHGQNLADIQVLMAAGAAGGLDAAQVQDWQGSDQGLAELQVELAQGQQAGIRSVPTFVINQRWAIAGAQPVAGFVQALRQIAAELAERYAGACVGYQNLNSVDVVAPGCSKGTGIAFVREHFGAHSVAAMGDSFNDLPMLEAADVAYTFPYVVEDVRDAADYLVSGVAEALEHFA